MSKRLLQSGLIVSAMTFVSRVLGLVRDVVVANLMGAGASADVFFLPIKSPTFCVVYLQKVLFLKHLYPY